MPRVVTVTDREGRLVAAGEINAKGIRWCEPVKSDGEARMVITEASRLRGEAFAQTGLENADAARRLRFAASLLEGRLVDKVWRGPARAALLQAA